METILLGALVLIVFALICGFLGIFAEWWERYEIGLKLTMLLFAFGVIGLSIFVLAESVDEGIR